MEFKASFKQVFLGGVALRLGMLVYGLWMDANFTVKYTDIDYQVFTDAARFVHEGYSPYSRSTYRYTPLLAWLLTPNIWLFNSFGKLLFVGFDCIVGWLIYQILVLRGIKTSVSTKYAALWLLNPQVANISTRGSAESMIGAFTLGCFYSLMKKHLTLAAVLFGIVVHLKLYPIIYALPILAVLDRKVFEDKSTEISSRDDDKTSKKGLVSSLINWCNTFRVQFALQSALTFLVLNIVMLFYYGDEFIQETYLYHVTRKDHRHNFSIWFLPIYIDFKSASSEFISLASFIPQLLVVAVLGIKFGKDLLFAAFVQTFAFVAYNKVCTAQYFMWYCCFVPLILPFSKIKLFWRGATLLGLWILPQALYLREAYAFEFVGQGKFVELWICGIIMFIANNYILVSFIKDQNVLSLFDKDGSIGQSSSGEGSVLHEKTA